MEERTTTREDDSLPLPELGPHNFTNRELSAIEFDKRVLAQAQDESVPLLERLRFLAIFGNNMDEFFMGTCRLASAKNPARNHQWAA